MKDLTPPAVDTARVARAFRRGLGSYHGAASAQAQIAAELSALLAKHVGQTPFSHLFEFGVGTGHLTDALLRDLSVARLTLNDLVPEAEAGLVSIMKVHGQSASFLPGRIEGISLPETLDLIAAASVVQWVSDLPFLLRRFEAALCPGGWLALSGFGSAHFHELVALGSDAAAPNYMDHHQWAGVLPEGLQLIELRQAPIVLRFDSPRAVLHHLRDTGVNGQSRGGWSRGRLQAFEDAYRSRFPHQGGVRLTYDPVLMLARRV
ncbi:methyltransferase [Phaeobacter inhibens]|uniref:methyltransferase n=1 Tax=Phaeobacter inhibens TaxID=221822 RepID=UPI000C9A11DB|nr:methyltransferase [Phaeobacter inhibens]AUR02885.1 putative biotin synthesis protein BioC [Phaeobacter inhibens]UWR40860.1 methyltransferase [Phaeobacter inhibens]UWR73403.1 methyltransferase [Phaeobacter inhibens]